MNTLSHLVDKLQRATVRLEGSHCQILPPGDYEFVILEAREEHDNQRKYDYLWLRLDCGGKLTSDRFPIVDNMLWKINQLLAAVGLDVDDLNDVKDLDGRSGEFIAEAKGSQTFYKYRPKNG